MFNHSVEKQLCEEDRPQCKGCSAKVDEKSIDTGKWWEYCNKCHEADQNYGLEEEEEEEELCCVCMEKPPNNTLLCKHKICPECMGKLHANECPQCRQPVLPNLQPPRYFGGSSDDGGYESSDDIIYHIYNNNDRPRTCLAGCVNPARGLHHRSCPNHASNRSQNVIHGEEVEGEEPSF
jgi:hypothetical protein